MTFIGLKHLPEIETEESSLIMPEEGVIKNLKEVLRIQNAVVSLVPRPGICFDREVLQIEKEGQRGEMFIFSTTASLCSLYAVKANCKRFC
jgi:C1A family cysteine protease